MSEFESHAYVEIIFDIKDDAEKMFEIAYKLPDGTLFKEKEKNLDNSLGITKAKLEDPDWWLENDASFLHLADKAIKFSFIRNGTSNNTMLNYSNMSNFILESGRLADDSNVLLAKVAKKQPSTSIFGKELCENQYNKISPIALAAMDSIADVRNFYTTISELDDAKNPSDRATILAKAMGNVFNVASNLSELIPGVVGNVCSTVFKTAADTLDKGLSVVTKYVNQLRELDEEIEKIINGDEYMNIEEMKEFVEYGQAYDPFLDDETRNIVNAKSKELLEYDEALKYYESEKKVDLNGDGNVADEKYDPKKHNKSGGGSSGNDNGAGSEADNNFQNGEKSNVDPIVLDMNDDGFDPTELSDGVNFDLDVNGMAERINWTRGDEALLAYDRNGDGEINDGTEVFGDNTPLEDGSKAVNGFAALAEFDTNKDGIINEEDKNFDKLLIWNDKNHNGISEKGELSTLSENDIISIALEYENLNSSTDTGVVLGNVSKFTYGDGREARLAEYWVLSQKFNTVDKNPIEIPDEIAKLPDIKSMGNAYSLHKAMALDDSGELVELVNAFAENKSLTERNEILDAIIYKLTDAENVQEGSRGENISAKKLVALECLLGHSYSGQDGTNPNSAAAPLLEAAYNALANMYYCELIAQTSLKDYLSYVYVQTKDGVRSLDISLLCEKIRFERFYDDNNDLTLYDAAKYLKYVQQYYFDGCFDEFRAYFEKHSSLSVLQLIDQASGNVIFGDNGDNVLYGSSEKNIVYGYNGNDVINGSAADEKFYGGAGNDVLEGGYGDDELHGGTGNDKLYGYTGNDTYVFELGDGQDIINEQESNSVGDKVVFGEGITPDDIKVTRDKKDMVLLIGDNGDSLRIVNQFNDSWYHIETFEFADGTVLDKSVYLGATITTTGSGEFSDPDDYATGTTILIGSDTDDTIIGNGRTDIIYGGAGNDVLEGGYDDDELHGETGNDKLYGYTGNDTYVFELGDGQDIINEQESNSVGDKVVFGEGITPDDIKVTRDKKDMVLLIGDNGDSLRIVNQFNDSWYHIETFEFADGTVLDKSVYLGATITTTGSGEFSDPDDYATGTTILIGSDTDDTIIGNGRTDIIYGGAGNDVLKGGYDDDELHGGTGNDKLYGYTGNDTYVFELGDGQDIINEQESNSVGDKVVFGEGITPDDIKVTRDKKDMVLLIGDNGDSLRIVNQFNDSWYHIETFEFADGTVLDKSVYFGATITTTGSGEFSDPDDYATGTTILIGSDTDDTIIGNGRTDIIYGGAGNDVLKGGYDDDELHGGTGNDKLYGYTGNDTYVFELGDGQDIINEQESNSVGDKVVFGEGITPDDITVTRDKKDMVLLIGDNGDSLRIVNQFNDSWYHIETFEFADGTVLDKSVYFGATITTTGSGEFSDPDDYATGTTILIGSDTDDTIIGNGRTDIIYGGAGNDVLEGGHGDDELHGGTGNDKLYGYTGNDTYVFELGDGQDIINEQESNSVGDKVVFGEGITPDDIKVTRDKKDMVLLIGDNGDSLRIVNQFNDSWYHIETFEFADGTVLDKSVYFGATITTTGSGEFSDPDDYATGTTILIGSDTDDTIIGNGRTDIIYGGAGNDVLEGGHGDDELHGGTGNDKLYGYTGNDTYVFELGDGQDIINEQESNSVGDKVVFGEGITPDDIRVTRDKKDMVLLIGDNGDSLRIVNQFNDSWYHIETFEFADGTVLDKSVYFGATITTTGSGEFSDPDDYATGTTILIGSDTDDTIIGNGRTDIIYGGAGNDVLEGGHGDDELHGGTGNDKLYGYTGNDTYVFELGDGQDIINEQESNSVGDKVVFGEGITPDDIRVTRDKKDMVLLIGDNGDSLRIVNQFNDSWYHIETFEFADGTVLDKSVYFGATITTTGSGEFSDPDDYATGTTILIGSDTDDTIIGNGRTDIIYGGAGNDVLKGGYDDDELHGGTGNDKLYGYTGNDTYVFELGDGQDIINEQESNSVGDKVVFGEGITPDDIKVTRDKKDMVLLIGDNGDSLRIVNQFNDSWYHIETFEFADGTVLDKSVYFGATITTTGSGEFSDPDDYATGTTILIGSDTDDTIIGNGRTDIIYGGAGNDVLKGGYDDDELHGGTGNDKLYGYTGNDTYVFELGDGQDIINEQESNSVGDKVVFGEGITPDDIKVTRDKNDMVLLIGDNGDSLRIVNQFSDSWYQIETFEFADGTVAHINLNTSTFVIDIEGTTVTVEQTNAEYLANLYTNDVFTRELKTDNTVIAEVTNSISISEESDDIADITNIQAMLLAENMSAFGCESQIYNGIDPGEITTETSALDQLLINTSMQ